MKKRLIRLAIEAGAQRVGFARACAVDNGCAMAFDRWLAEGRNGSMGYMANYPQLRRDPRLLLEGGAEARTVIVCAFSYYHSECQAAGAARFAMYAHGSDYHEVLRERLRPLVCALQEQGYAGRVCVDSAPVMERYWAVQAGVGFTGLNSQLIVPGMGSYFFLAEIVTDAVLEPDEPCRQDCGRCGRCVAACPGGAIGADGSFDARRCLSYLTIEHRGELPERAGEREIGGVMADRVYGCDECQRVCPHNRQPQPTAVEDFLLRPDLRHITVDDILRMTQPEFSRVFSHSAVKRVKLAGLQRNAKAVMSRKR